MAALRLGEWEIDGYTFGHETSKVLIVPDGLDLGATTVRAQDVDNDYGDNTRMGRDRLAAPTWTFDLMTNEYAASPASDALNGLAAAWLRHHRILKPGNLQTLRYNMDGRTRIAYGRGRKFGRAGSTLGFTAGVEKAIATFDLAEPFVYDDDVQGLYLQLVPSSTTGLKSGALIANLRSRYSLGQRQGQIVVGGTAPTPLVIRIYGPIASPSLTCAGWSIKLNTNITAPNYVEIDTRGGTVRLNGVTDIPSVVAPGSKLVFKMERGANEVIFKGTDRTNTSHAEIVWRPANYLF